MPLRVSRTRVGFAIGTNPEPTGKYPDTSANTSIVVSLKTHTFPPTPGLAITKFGTV